jgi:adenine specific DNA methylase Mod
MLAAGELGEGMNNVLYYGDNLHILRHYIPDDSVDLIYLDPPFNSQANYNVLFREESGASSHAQIEAFEDTWHWGDATAEAYDEVLRGPHQNVARMLKAMVDSLGHNQVTAYLAMMAIRLVELRRVLKETGSIYLHCDPTSSHYLKTLMDAVFGPQAFVNEIIWKRTTAHSDARQGSKHFGRTHDVILHFGHPNRTWNAPYLPYDAAYEDTYYKFVDETGRRYWKDNLTAAKPGGDTSYEWNGVRPPKGRYWAYSKANMERMAREGRIVYSKTGTPMYKRYLDEMPGKPVQDLWDDIRGLGGLGGKKEERLGYATQKPLALLERIITASSNPGDIVLDPFCGCGTAVHAAQKLGRQWIGIDITHLAIGLIRRRMKDAFPDLDIKVIGEPVDLPGARDLAHRDKYQFQWWALDQLGAQPVAGKKKGADKGIDGVIPLVIGGTAQKPEYARAIVSVKGGDHVSSPVIRDLKGVLDREKEPIGILLTLANPTKDMTTEAAASGFYESDLWHKKYPRIQIITIEDLLNGKRPDIPSAASPFARAPLEREKAETERLL